LNHLDRGANLRLQIYRLQLDVLLGAREIADAADALGRVADQPVQRVDMRGDITTFARPDSRQAKSNGVQSVVQVVRDAGRELTNGSQALVAEESLVDVMEPLQRPDLLRGLHADARNQGFVAGCDGELYRKGKFLATAALHQFGTAHRLARRKYELV